jgi:hypothetical protein
MEAFIGGVLVGLVIGVVGRPLLAAWLWTRERSRVSRVADARFAHDGSSRAEILPESRNGPWHPTSAGEIPSTPRRPPHPRSG